MVTVTSSTHLPVSCEEAFAWHTRPGAFERMLPPWEHVQIVKKVGSLQNGDKLCMKVKFGPVPVFFSVIHQNYLENNQFEDKQVKGPFSHWKHTHKFEKIDNNKCKITDIVDYKLPLGFASSVFNRLFMKDKLDKLFAFRHRTLIHDLYLHSLYSQKKLKILVTGSSGFIAHDLIPFLTAGGHEVIRLSRNHINSSNIGLRRDARSNVYEKRNAAELVHEQDSNKVVNQNWRGLDEKRSDVVLWDSENHTFKNPEVLENLDAVVHLAGENIASKKWSEQRKQELIQSRVNFTKQLCEALVTLKKPPQTFISASGAGIFGSRDVSEVLTEDSQIGEGFLAKLAHDWENASSAIQKAGVRVVHLRFGAIISSRGGMLKKLLTPYKLFIGGPMGSGKQILPWISMVDVLGIILFSLARPEISGPVNAVSPHTVTNEQFSEILAQCLDRPNSLRIPEMFIELFFGEMGKEVILYGQNVKPVKATQLGFHFFQTHLHDCLSYFLGN